MSNLKFVPRCAYLIEIQELEEFLCRICCDLELKGHGYFDHCIYNYNKYIVQDGQHANCYLKEIGCI